MLDPTTQEEGQLGSPAPQIAQKMNLRKTPMDMNINRNVKLMQVSSKVAEKASSDGTTNKQCRPVHRQSTETTVNDAYTNFADKPKPTLSQRPAVAVEEAGTDGTIDVQCRPNDHDYMKTTVMNLPTDFVKVTKPTLSRVSPVGTKEAHTDGFFLELTEEARYVDVGSGQSCYTEEVQSQEAGLTRPVLVTIMECSSSVPKGGGGGYDSSRYFYREYTTYFCYWAPLPSGPVGPSWPLRQDREVGFARIGQQK